MAGRVLTIEIKVTGGASQTISTLVTALNDLSAAQRANARATQTAAAAQKQNAESVAQILRAYREMTAEGKKSKKAQEEIAEASKKVAEANKQVASFPGYWENWSRAINSSATAFRTSAAAANASAAASRLVTSAFVAQGQAGMAASRVAALHNGILISSRGSYNNWTQAINAATAAHVQGTAAGRASLVAMQSAAQYANILGGSLVKQGQAASGAAMWAGVLRGALIAQGQAGYAASAAAAQMAASHRTFGQVIGQAAASLKSFIVNLLTGKNAAGGFVVGLNQAATQGMKLKNAIDDARRSAYALTIAGAQTKAIFGQMSNALGGAIDKLTEFDFNLRRAAGATQVFDDTSDAFKRVEQDAKNLAVTTKMFSSADIAKGMYFWASTTGEAADATSELIPVLKMAAMTDTGYEQSIKGVVNILQQFGEPMSNAQHVTEELFQVTQKTALEFPNLIESFKMVGPVAANFGVSIDEMMKLFGVLGDVGIKGSMAGRAMAMMFSQIADPTDKATAALNKYAEAAGMIKANGNFWDLVWPEGKFVGVQGFLNLLTDMTKNLNEQEKNALLAAITTQNEWRALAPLIDANTRSIIESGQGILLTTDVMSGAAQSFAGAWDMMAKSVKATFQEMQNRIDNLIMTFGRAMMEVLQPLIQKVNEVAESLQKWADANPEMMRLAAAVALVVTAFFALTSVVLLASGYFMLLKNVAMPTLGMITGHFTSMTTVAEASGKGFTIFSHIITQIITKIPQIAALVAVFTLLAGVVAGIASEIGPNLGRLFASLGRVLGAITQIVVSLLGGLFNLGLAIGKTIAPAVGLAVDGLSLFLDLLMGIGGFVGDTLGAWVNMFVDLGEAVAGALGGMKEIGGILKVISDAITAYQNAANTPGGGLDLGKDMGGKMDPNTFGAVAMAGAYKQVAANNAVAEAEKTLAAATEASNQAIMRKHVNEERAEQTAYDYAAAQKAAADAEKERKDAIQVVVDSFAVFNGVVDKALTDINSSNQKAGTAAYNTLRTYAATMIEQSPLQIPPAVKTMFTAASNAVKSNTAAGREIGKKITAIIAEGYRTGTTELIMPRVNHMLEGIIEKIHSGNPALVKSGADSFRAVAEGMLQSTAVDDATKGQLSMAIQMLNSGVPAMVEQGALLIQAIASGMYSKMPMVLNAIKSISPIFKMMTGVDLAGMIKPVESAYKALETSGAAFNPKDWGGNKDTSGGGGGGGGDTQSPLEKALEVAKNAADLAEALVKIKGMDIKKLVQEAMGPVAEAMVLAERITYKAAKGFSKEHLQRVADFSDAMSKMVGFINGAFDAFTKAKDFKAVSSTVLNKLFDAVAYSVKQMEAIAKKLTGTKGRDSLLAQTVIFAEAAGTVVNTIGSAFEAFSKVPKEFTAPPKELLDEVSKAIGDAVASMEQVAKDTDTSLLNAAKDFSEAAKSVMDAIGAGLDLFSKKFDIKIPTPDDMKRIVAGIRLAVETLVTEVRLFNEQYGMTYGEGGEMAVFREFADTAKGIMEAIQQAFTLFQPQEYREMGPGLKNPLMMVSELVDDMVQVIQTVNDKFAEIKLTMTVDQIKALIDVAKGVMDAIQTFFGLASQVTSGADSDRAAIQTLIDASLQKVMDVVLAFTEKFEDRGIDLINNFAKGLGNQSALANLDLALSQLQQRITSALSGIGTLTVHWSSGGNSAAAESPSGGGGGGVQASAETPTGDRGGSSAGQGNQGITYSQDSSVTWHQTVDGVYDAERRMTGYDSEGNPTYGYFPPGSPPTPIDNTNNPANKPPQGRAVGGNVMPGNSYIVGERGPEELRMGDGGGGVIIPINTTKQGGGLGTGGGPNVVIDDGNRLGGGLGVGGGITKQGGLFGGGVGGITTGGISGSMGGALTVNVTSSDGSVNRVGLRELGEIISGNLRSNLQHSASVR